MFNGKTSSRNNNEWTNEKKHMNPQTKNQSCVSRRGWTVSVVGWKDGRTGWLFSACSKVQNLTCYAFVCVFFFLSF